jgi:hypothetical protein
VSKSPQHPPFSLPDSQGKTHEYKVIPHHPDEGIPLALKITGLGLGPAFEGFKRLAGLPEVRAQVELQQAGAAMDMSGFLEALPTADVTQLIDQVRLALLHEEGPALIRRVLQHTFRDGESLGQSPVFGSAYQANYGEMLAAFARVVGINDFFTVASLFAGSSRAATDKTSG